MKRIKGKIATLQPKERAWQSVGAHPVAADFFWITSDEQRIQPRRMNTFHLFNALLMVWNHARNWSKHVLFTKPTKRKGRLHQRAVANLFNEMMNRPDRTTDMEEMMLKIARSVVKKKTTIR